MRKNPRKIGDAHVIIVSKALTELIKNMSIKHFPFKVIQTANYIKQLYPNVVSVESKFEKSNTNNAKDLMLYLSDNTVIEVNLFLIGKGGRIQPKNPGAKSFFTKYFLSKPLQEMFNIAFERHYLEYLKNIVTYKSGDHYIMEKRELKKIVSNYFPKFTDEINLYRETFLYKLRESCFTLLKDYYNGKSEGFYHAYKIFFMTEDVNIVTSYGKKENDVKVECLNSPTPKFDDIQIYKVGKNTVGIRYGEVALTLRFKFESSPTSSIKLAASYDNPEAEEKEIINENTTKKMLTLLHNHEYTHKINSSNAIGKCHEAITYFYFIKDYPDISQVEPNECVTLFGQYYNHVNPEVLKKIYRTTATIIPVIMDKLVVKYDNFDIESIELVPDGYVKNRLDTGDIQLLLRVNGEYIIEKISLKALAKRNKKVTTKNPGIGTILGPTYFGIGNIDPIVNEVKAKYQIGKIDRTESLEILAEELGIRLKEANQENLKQGIESLLGEAMMAITFYDQNYSYCQEHSKIDSYVKVYIKSPTAIQNTIAWNNDSDTINLRVKFSKGKKHGWSSIKLTSEYRLNNN